MVLLAPFRSAPLLPLLLGLASASLQDVIAAPGLSINSVPHGTRAHWMRAANAALADVGGSPCPFAAFGSVVVNHTDADGPGQLVCVGANANSRTGNPTLHGEMAAIANCTAVLTDPEGAYRLSASEALDAFKQLSLYTNAESCPMVRMPRVSGEEEADVAVSARLPSGGRVSGSTSTAPASRRWWSRAGVRFGCRRSRYSSSRSTCRASRDSLASS